MGTELSYSTMQQNSIRHMLKYVEEFEQITQKSHLVYKTKRAFFKDKAICYQNFYKFYNRYVISQRNPQALLPTRSGPKPKYQEMPQLGADSLEAKVLAYRQQGHNKYIISEALKKETTKQMGCSPSTVYRILKSYGLSKLTKAMTQEKRRYVRDKAGSLAHIDCHYLPKGIVQSEPLKRYYVLGVMDDYSRLVWVEVISSTKALDATFAMLDALTLFNQRYGIQFAEALTDNGSEFCGGKTTFDEHPFERLLVHFAIKHRRTKPYRPQTNGKIERFWRTFDDEVIEGSVFNTQDALKDAVLGYNFYYNEHRPHQGIDGKLPLMMLEKGEEI